MRKCFANSMYMEAIGVPGPRHVKREENVLIFGLELCLVAPTLIFSLGSSRREQSVLLLRWEGQDALAGGTGQVKRLGVSLSV